MSEPNDRERVIPDQERARALLEQLKGVHAVDIARDMVIATVNFSYPKLGLSDETRPVRDLDDVRVSIELIRAVLEVLDREHGGETTSDLHDTLAQMQLAYAHAVQLANAEQAGRREAAPAEAEEEPDVPAEAQPDAPAETAEPEAQAEAAEEPKKRPAAKKPAAKKKPTARKKPSGES